MSIPPVLPDVRDAAILVVDDVPANREGLVAFLRAEGFFRVEVAADATAAMDQLVAGHVDLVLLDVMLPDMPGDRVLAWMDTDSRLRQVPVIVVSGVDEMRVVIRCLEAGAVDFLPKPVDPVLLRARLYPALERKRLRDALTRSHARIERELAQARALQLGMVPGSFPAADAPEPVERHAVLLPAREVGGDLYDCFFVGTDCYAAVGDVSGKGAAAALFMARTLSALRVAARTVASPLQARPALGDIVRAVNEELCRHNESLMFTSLLVVRLDPASGNMDVVNAGHPAALALSSRGVVRRIDVPVRIPLGIDPRAALGSATAMLHPGETLLLHSDGVVEAADPSGALFGDARLGKCLAACGGLAPAAVVSAIERAVIAFRGDAVQSDDIAVLALRRGA